MNEIKAPNARQDQTESYLVTLARDHHVVKGPISIIATSHIAAARLAYEELNAKDNDLILVWVLNEFQEREEPVTYAAGNLRFNQPISPKEKGLTSIVSEAMDFNRRFESIAAPDRETTGSIDEYNTRRLGTGQFEVYRLLGVKPGGQEVHYAKCKTVHAAQLIARALNIVAAMEGWIVETIPYPDGHIFIVVKGAEAKESYLKVLPILKGGNEQ